LRMDNCIHITVIYNYFKNDSCCVYAPNCVGWIVVNHNIFKDFAGQAVQYSQCTGPGNRINYNKIRNSTPNSLIGDEISLYKSYGMVWDPIRVYGNDIVGGGTNSGSLGYAGIVAGDVGGAYQDIENNRLVNTGYVGIQQQGGSYIKIKNNLIYSDSLPWSGGGLLSANYSGIPSVGSEISHNQILWYAGYSLCGCSGERDTSWRPGNTGGTNGWPNARPIGWNTNRVHVTTLSAASIPSF
jgi:hypothetical protein